VVFIEDFLVSDIKRIDGCSTELLVPVKVLSYEYKIREVYI